MEPIEVFQILGIEQTKDERALKNAYRDKLAVTNPEDDPEGFKRLRMAYEEACRYAGTPDAIFPEEITLGAGEVLLLVVVLLVLADLVFLLVMKYKYTVGFKNRKLREFIDRLAKHEKRFRREK